MTAQYAANLPKAMQLYTERMNRSKKFHTFVKKSLVNMKNLNSLLLSPTNRLILYNTLLTVRAYPYGLSCTFMVWTYVVDFHC